MPSKKTQQSIKEEKLILSKMCNEIMHTKRISSITKLRYTTVIRHTNNLTKDGKLFKRKHNNNNYFCVSERKIKAMPSRIDRIYDVLKSNGDMRIDDVVDKLISYSKTSIFNVINAQTDDNTKVYSYYIEGEQYQMLTINKPTDEMTSVKKSGQPYRNRWKHKYQTDKSVDEHERQELPKFMSPVKRQLVKPTRGHNKFKKYNDHSIKVHSQMVETISSLIVLFQTSEDPYLYMHKLRHRIETMPEAYWCEQVSLDSYVKDIDMVELPKTGANKDIDRSP